MQIIDITRDGAVIASLCMKDGRIQIENVLPGNQVLVESLLTHPVYARESKLQGRAIHIIEADYTAIGHPQKYLANILLLNDLYQQHGLVLQAQPDSGESIFGLIFDAEI